MSINKIKQEAKKLINLIERKNKNN